MMKLRKTDGILLVVLLALSFLPLCFYGSSSQQPMVEILVDGSLYGRYPLQPRRITVVSEYGENTVEITDHGVRVLQASCPNQWDVKQGEITAAGQCIVCLPNRLVIRLVGQASHDAISY